MEETMPITEEMIEKARNHIHEKLAPMAFSDMVAMFLENKVIPTGDDSLSGWFTKVEKNGVEFTFWLDIGAECEDDRGWWSRVSDPVKIISLADKVELGSLIDSIRTRRSP